MGIPKLLEDLAIISKLGDNPGSDNGLTTNAFRAKFDEAALKIQEYINNTIVPAICAVASPENGMSMKANIAMNGYQLTELGVPTDSGHAATKGYVDGKTKPSTLTLSATSWTGNVQSVAVEGLMYNDDVDVCPAPSSYSAYCDAGVYCSAQSNGALTFVCNSVPDTDLTVNIRVWN